MSSNNAQLWERFQKYYYEFADLGLTLDLSRMNFGEDFFSKMDGPLRKAFQSMAELEKGAIANPDEKRMVGHYWLRNPSLAPNPEISTVIKDTLQQIKTFAVKVHSGEIAGTTGPFKNVLVIGIGGSALGPQFVAKALGKPNEDKMRLWFFDNTDPDGMDYVLQQLEKDLGQTLVLVISKSGGTKETRNGMLEAERTFLQAGLNPSVHFVAVTGDKSELDNFAAKKGWLARFPMWDWVGGRTSETSAVGLLPAALQGLDIDEFLRGAAACDGVTRSSTLEKNPAALMALMWHYATNGKGEKDMVVLPYKDRLELLSKYLQQLIMESLGKEHDLSGKVVNQGISVYGNKGSTDQHAYIQQLRDGVANFFATFIQVGKERAGDRFEVEAGFSAGDYLHGFLRGTRQALHEKGRESITLTISEVSPFTVGLLIALFERAVGLYGFLVNINSYHQPGVEAGKKAATAVLELQRAVQTLLEDKVPRTCPEIAEALGNTGSVESVFHVATHLAANGLLKKSGSASPAQVRFSS